MKMFDKYIKEYWLFELMFTIKDKDTEQFCITKLFIKNWLLLKGLVL